MLIGGLLLDLFKTNGFVFIGFGVLFSIAMLARLYSIVLFKKQYAPKFKLKKGYYFSFWDFLIKSPKTNFGMFSIFRALIAFSCSISAPLLAVYLLRHLEFDYITYMVIILSASLRYLLLRVVVKAIQ